MDFFSGLGHCGQGLQGYTDGQGFEGSQGLTAGQGSAGLGLQGYEGLHI